MQIVPLQPVPSQTVNVTLANQSCTLNVYTTAFGLFFDLLVNNVLIVGGTICENRNRLIRSLYLGFIGDFVFVDLQGLGDPIYTGLGTKYLLVYLEASDLPAGQG